MPFTVQDLIKDRRKPVVVGIADTAATAVELMMEHDFSQLPVVDQDDRPRGMVTSDSILRAHSSLDLPLGKLHVRDAMAKKPREFEAGDDLFEMLEYVMDSDAVFVVDGEGRLTGIVTSYDTTEYFRRRAEDLMLIEDIEMALRDHLRAAYSDLNGLGVQALDAAVAELVRDRAGMRGKFKNAIKRYAAKTQAKVDDAAAGEAFEAAFVGKSTSTKFEDLNLSEFIQMVVHGDRWVAHFQPLFGIEPGALDFMLGKVRETRNLLAHFHGALEPAQRSHLRFCAEWLTRHPPPPAPKAQVVEPSVTPAPPSQPEAAVEDQNRGQAEDFSSEDSRYAPLAAFLQAQPGDRVVLSFADVEKIIDGPLPAYARKHPSWWANDSVGHVQSRQWLQVGWRMYTTSIAEEKVTFYRPTERAQAYLAFYNAMVETVEKTAPGIYTAAKPIGLNWLNIRYVSSGGQRAAALAFTFALRGRFRVEIYISSGDRDRNKAIFDRLYARRQEIEAQLGEVSWERLENKQASRIGVYHPGSIDDPPEKLEALRVWGAERLARMNAVLVPLLEQAQNT